MNGKRQLHGSFNHGSMANAMPQALGAQAANPGRQVVSLSGDGGLSMLMGDLLTARQLNLPIKIVVFNNGLLGFVSMELKAAGYLDANVDLAATNFGNFSFSIWQRKSRDREAPWSCPRVSVSECVQQADAP